MRGQTNDTILLTSISNLVPCIVLPFSSDDRCENGCNLFGVVHLLPISSFRTR